MPTSGGTSGSAVGSSSSVATVPSFTGETENQLSLELWRRIMGWNPWHFWGLADDNLVPVTSACNTVVREYAWQNNDSMGRAEIRRAIASAEARLREYLGFSTGRRFVEEIIPFPRPKQYGQYGAHIDGSGRWLSVTLPEGFVRNVGIQTHEIIDESLSVTYTDEDGDGLFETATLTVATTVTDANEIAVYFNSSDRLHGEPVSEKYRISPCSIKISGGTATIKINTWLLVKPIKYQGVSPAALSPLLPATSGVFATSLAVYRRYADTTGTTNATVQALLEWETDAYPDWAVRYAGSDGIFSSNSRDPAAIAYGLARVGIRDKRRGIVSLGRADYNSTTGEWVARDWAFHKQPDRIVIRYEAGVPYEGAESSRLESRLQGRWDEIAARFGTAELGKRISSCDQANQEIYRWQFDMSRAAGANDEQYRISDRDLNNPFGSRQGQIYAWRNVVNLKRTRAFLPG